MTQPPWGQPSGGQPGHPPQWPQPVRHHPVPPHGFSPQGFGGQSAWPSPPAPAAMQQTWRPAPGPRVDGHHPHGGWQPPAPPQKKPVAPVVILSIVAVMAVLAAVVVTRGGDNPDAPEITYKNDDYQVPPPADQAPPMPGHEPGNERTWLADNRLYGLDLPTPVRCDVRAMELEQFNEDQVRVQLEATLVCLLRTWGPTLEQAGYTVTHPRVFMYRDIVQNACGKTKMRNAQFCSTDQNLYFATDWHTLFSPGHWQYEAIMAHEFAHALQGRSGIIRSRNLLWESAPTKAEQYLLSRRTEAQADCFAGLFFNSVQQSMGLAESDTERVRQMYGSIGNSDPSRVSTHPLGHIRHKWYTTGFTTTSVGACNTWVAPTDQVA